MIKVIRPVSMQAALPYIVLCIALFGAASALVAVRLAQNEGVPSLAIVVVRLSLTTLLLTPLALPRHRPVVAKVTRREWGLMALGGLLFTGDIALFAEAIHQTSLLLATVIGGLLPLWTALMERLILKVPLPRSVYIGLALALVGGAVIAFAGNTDGAGLGPNPLLGAVLALGSGLSAALYLIIARSIRPHMPLVPYIWVVFGFAAAAAIILALVTRVSITGYGLQGYVWVLAATVIGQMIAHPSFNFSVGYLSPTFISISSQSITFIAAILAFLLFREVPGTGELIGSAIILTGIVFAINGQRKHD